MRHALAEMTAFGANELNRHILFKLGGAIMSRIKTLLQEYWLIVIVALGAGGFFWWQSRQVQTLAPIAESSSFVVTSSSGSAASSSKPQAGFVHIKGAVAKPGLYPVDGTTRWDEVVRLAGGLTADADVSAVNLALIATDQASLWIPEKGAAPAAQTAPPSAPGATSDAALVNINTATETELQTLSGIGPKKAADIIAYREANGNFAAIEDLKNVSGIGDKTYEALQDAITVGP